MFSRFRFGFGFESIDRQTSGSETPVTPPAEFGFFLAGSSVPLALSRFQSETFVQSRTVPITTTYVIGARIPTGSEVSAYEFLVNDAVASDLDDVRMVGTEGGFVFWEINDSAEGEISLNAGDTITMRLAGAGGAGGAYGDQYGDQYD